MDIPDTVSVVGERVDSLAAVCASPVAIADALARVVRADAVAVAVVHVRACQVFSWALVVLVVSVALQRFIIDHVEEHALSHWEVVGRHVVTSLNHIHESELVVR